MFLDKWQYTIAEMEGTTYGQNGQGIPVLTYEEMAGLILGYDPWADLGMQMHQVDVEPLLDKLGIAIRTGHHCAEPLVDWYGIPGTARASFAFYNTKAEIDYFFSSLKRVLMILK